MHTINLMLLLLIIYVCCVCVCVCVCADVNECLTNKGGCAQICLNQPGSRECTCRDGYQLDSDSINCNGESIIIIMNLCVSFTRTYTFYKQLCLCTHTHGTHMHTHTHAHICMHTYTHVSTDINECVELSDNNCHSNATCTNINGGFNCACREGFLGEGTACEGICYRHKFKLM